MSLCRRTSKQREEARHEKFSCYLSVTKPGFPSTNCVCTLCSCYTNVSTRHVAKSQTHLSSLHVRQFQGEGHKFTILIRVRIISHLGNCHDLDQRQAERALRTLAVLHITCDHESNA